MTSIWVPAQSVEYASLIVMRNKIPPHDSLQMLILITKLQTLSVNNGMPADQGDALSENWLLDLWKSSFTSQFVVTIKAIQFMQ